jgi:hypothetical protein
LPERKNYWLYRYDQVKYRTPLQWGVLFFVSIILAAIGSLGVWSVVRQYNAKHGLGTGVLALAAMSLAIAAIELPAAVIFFYRRWRGEMTEYFDYEVMNETDQKRTDGVHHGSDHR